MNELNYYTYQIKAKPEDIDILEHVNNEVYLRWFMSAAIAHSKSAGFSTQFYKDQGSAFVVRRHEIDYLASALLNDTILVHTWIGEIANSKCVREYKMVRPADNKTLARAKTIFIYIDLSSGRPKRIHESILEYFKAYERDTDPV